MSGNRRQAQKIAQLYARRAARFNTRTNEAQTEKDFIRPVLDYRLLFLLYAEDRNLLPRGT